MYKVYFEIHPNFASEIVDLFLKAKYLQAKTVKDMSGTKRFVIASK